MPLVKQTKLRVLRKTSYNSVTADVCNVVISGTLFVLAAITALLLRSYIETRMDYTFYSLLVCAIAFLYIVSTYLLLRKFYYRTVAFLLVSFYMLTAGGIVWVWGINTPIGLLVFALSITLAGILLTARNAIYAAILSGFLLIGIQAGIDLRLHQPDTSWITSGSSFGDVLAYATLFVMLALISWLYNREIERSLTQARQAEAAVTKQKAMLKVQVEERTAELRQLQLEEMQHMYHFAELGKLGVTLLHDLADNVTALTLEMEGIEDRDRSESIERAQQITGYLDDIVESARKRLDGKTQRVKFNIVRLVKETIDFSQKKATKNSVTIDWQPPDKSLSYVGDPDSLGQIIAIIISNSIDAYDYTPTSVVRKVTVAMERRGSHIIIRISDKGKGITKAERKDLFRPHHSTKKSGLGIGLFITKQIIELQFSGTVALSPRTDGTEFVITLPVSDEN